MLRNRAVALILGLIASPLGFALGLGPIQSDSFLNEPFSGRIELLGATAADFDTLNVRLASLEQFERAGISLNPLLYKLKFTVEGTGPGRDFVSITSKDPVREPFLNFLVELNWANGRLLREYTVLLDPPLYDARRQQRTTQPGKPKLEPASSTAPSSPPVPVAPTSVPYTPGISSYTAGNSLGPVVSSDTLWSIASAARPDQSISVQQMMLALLRENPEAFGEGNINLLRRGAVLRMPESNAMTAVSPADALAEVRRQHQLWEAYRGELAASPDSQPVGAPAPSTSVDADLAPGGDSRLELVAPGGTEAGDSPGTAAGGGADLLREEIDARAQQNAQLNDKLVEAEEIIDLLQRQVNIKDDELAALQARLAELGIENIDIAAAADDAIEALELEPGADEALPDGDDTAVEDDDEDMAAIDEPVRDDDFADADDVMDEPADAMEAPSDDVAPVTSSVADADTPRGFPHSLIPESIANLVPGGALTVLGLIAAVLLGIFAAIISFLTKTRDAKPQARPAVAAVAAAPAVELEEDATEDPTLGAATAMGDDDSEAVTEVGSVGDAADDFDPMATVEAEPDEETEATTEMPAVPLEEEDPLEEVNVYLAYERFDQAEELVKRVIGEYPDRHEYKARLLEVYYSSNDRQAYEAAARDLHDAVGESDPLWENAVAMWSAMSPERELFAEGAEAEPAAAPEDASAFVDITGDTDQAPTAGETTLAHVQGDGEVDFDLAGAGDSGDVLDLTPAVDDADEVLDLTATDAADEVLDLTATDAADEVLDLTATDAADEALDLTATDAADEVLDLPATDDAIDITGGGSDDDDVLDLTGGDDVFDLTAGADDSDDVLDVSGGGGESLLDISSSGISADTLEFEAPEEGESDLLDVTKTGDVAGVDDADLLNVTSSGLGGDEPTAASVAEDNADLEVTDITGAAGEALDFDISDTVAPAFDEVAGTGDEIVDLTGGTDLDSGGGDDLLDFDIGGLDDESPLEDTHSPSEESDADTIELDTAGISGGDDVDFDITMDAAQLGVGLDIASTDDTSTLELDAGETDAFDDGISLQSSDLSEDSELSDDDFDFALDGTTEMDSIAADDTLDMGKVDTSGELDEDASLADLTQQLDGALDDAGLDDLEIEGLDVPGAESDEDHLATLALDAGEVPSIDFDEKTVAMPIDDSVERQSDADEADTKLNLAKAYMELGDNDGARSILDEVSTEGNEAQQAEAASLLSQLPG